MEPTTPAVSTKSFDMPTEFPSMQPTVHLGFTILCTALYASLFLAAYWQLWLILYYKHRRLSYHTVFLSMCLVYAALRVVLFSFYFSNVIDATLLPLGWNWLLYSFPICIQFAMLCLLNLYFMQMLLQARARFGDSTRKQERVIRCVILSGCITFLGVSLLTASLNSASRTSDGYVYETDAQPNGHHVVLLRVLVHEGLFVIAGTSLAVSVFKLVRMSTANILLEAKGASLMQALMVAFCTVFLYMSRAIYNFVAVVFPRFPGFNYGWTNVSDEADLVDLANGYTYIAFGIVLIIWEFMPTSAVLIFFRVHKPVIEPISIEYSVNDSRAPYRTLFDNPAHYDSDDDEFVANSNAINNGNSVQAEINNGTSPSYQTRAYASMPFVRQSSIVGTPYRNHYHSTSGTATSVHGSGPMSSLPTARRNSSAVLGGFPTDPPFMRSAVIANRRPTLTEYAIPPQAPLTPRRNNNIGRHRRHQTISDGSGDAGKNNRAQTAAAGSRTGSFDVTLSVPGIFRANRRNDGNVDPTVNVGRRDNSATEPPV